MTLLVLIASAQLVVAVRILLILRELQSYSPVIDDPHFRVSQLRDRTIREMLAAEAAARASEAGR